MKKILTILSILIIFLLLFAKQTQAYETSGTRVCNWKLDPNPPYYTTIKSVPRIIQFTVTSDDFQHLPTNNNTIKYALDYETRPIRTHFGFIVPLNNTITFKLIVFPSDNPIHIKLSNDILLDDFCTYTLTKEDWIRPSYSSTVQCSGNITKSNNGELTTTYILSPQGPELIQIQKPSILSNPSIDVSRDGNQVLNYPIQQTSLSFLNQNLTNPVTLTESIGNIDLYKSQNGKYYAIVSGLGYKPISDDFGVTYPLSPLECAAEFEIQNEELITPFPTPTMPPEPPQCTRVGDPCSVPECLIYYPNCKESVPPEQLEICSNVVDNPQTDTMNEKADCLACAEKGNYIYTALGCLPTDPALFIKDYLYEIGLGIAGVLAFILMLFGSFTVMTSQGDPQKITKGKEIIVSAIAGIILIIFSLFIVRIIAGDVLKIPGFSGTPTQCSIEKGVCTKSPINCSRSPAGMGCANGEYCCIQ
jgi:hypothetical protein